MSTSTRLRTFTPIVVAAALALGGFALLPSCSEADPGLGSDDSSALVRASAPMDPLQALPRVAGSDAAAEELVDDVNAIADEDHGHAFDALAQASASGRYAFIFFSKTEDESTTAMRQVFDAALGKARDRADAIAVDVNDFAERDVVAKFGVAAAPMPLVLVVAPNGAVAGGFPVKFDEATLLNAFVSPGLEQCLKALQEGKLVLLCAQNGATAANDAATQGAQAFKADAKYAQVTAIIVVDPADAAESKLMAQLAIEPRTTEAVTALLAPPGTLMGTFKGAVTKEALVSALTVPKASSCCPPGTPAPAGGCK